MDRETAVYTILRRFMKAGRTSDLSDEGLLDDYDGHVPELVRALVASGMLEPIRGRTRGRVYCTTERGKLAIEQ